MPDRPQIKYRAGRPHIDVVCAALKATNGVVEAAARRLDMDGANLRKYIRTHPRCQAVKVEAREKLLDLSEQRLFELIDQRDLKAICYHLSTQGRSRGYILPKGAALTAETTNNVVIQSVTIRAVESGKFVTGPDEVDEPSVLGGSKLLVDPEKKLN